MILLALSAILREPGVTNATSLVIGSLLYQIIVVAFASYLTWFWLLSRYPASALAAFSFMVAGGLLLGERISGALAAAMLFVALGIFLVNRAPAA